MTDYGTTMCNCPLCINVRHRMEMEKLQGESIPQNAYVELPPVMTRAKKREVELGVDMWIEEPGVVSEKAFAGIDVRALLDKLIAQSETLFARHQHNMFRCLPFDSVYCNPHKHIFMSTRPITPAESIMRRVRHFYTQTACKE